MNKIYFLLLLVFITISIKSQKHYNNSQANISGLIIDEIDLSPLEFSTISLFKKKDSTLITGSIANSLGEFKLIEIPFGRYYAKISFIGYSTITIDDINISPNNQGIKLGRIKLKESSENLDAIEITSEANLMEVHIDKKIYNANKDLEAKGGTGLDVLRNVPSVDVDMDENITLRGEGNVQILIDGRPSSMPANILLKQLPASQVDKIEIITNPSAKYDPEGMSGILNIKLKKTDDKGANCNVNSSFSYGYTPKYNNTLTLNYKTSKMNAYTSFNSRNGSRISTGFQDRTTFINDTASRFYYNSDGNNLYDDLFAKAGLDYFINDKNTLYFSGSLYNSSGISYEDNAYSYYHYTNSLDSTSKRISESDFLWDQYQMNFGWQAEFSNPNHTFDFDLNYNNSTNNNQSEYTESFLDNSELPLGNNDLQNVNDYTNTNKLLIRADYVLPITDSIELELGYRGRFKNKLDGINSETYNYNSSEYISDTNINNIFKYSQIVNAGYVTFGHQLGKLGYKLGLRAEHTDTRSILENTNDTFVNPYFSLFPSIHTSYSFNENNEMQLSYSRRINRPNIYQLNPFIDYSNPYSLHVGNPFLMPEFIDVYELGYITRISGFFINSTVYFKQVNDLIRRYLEINGNVSKVSYVNFDKSNIGGAELIVSKSLLKKIRLTLSLNYWYSVISDDEYVGKNIPSTAWSGKFRGSYSFGKGWSSQVSFRYKAPMLVTQGLILPRYGLNMAINKKIMNKKGQLSLSVRDIFKTMNFSFVSDDNITNADFEMKHYWESRQITVNFSYFFGKTIKGKQKRNLREEEDASSIPDMQ